MIDLLRRSVLFFGGKGGVGKTTCAAATALEAARRGHRVLLVSVDPAHSLADVFDRSIGEAPVSLQPGLAARELDPATETERYLAAVREQVSTLFSPGVVKQAFRQFELAAQAPGLDDVAVFDRVMQLVLEPSRDCDLLIVDTAPTGHALRLLAMPQALADWLDALAGRRRDVLANASRQDAEQDPVLTSLRARAARVRAFHACLVNPSHTGFAFVLTPERLPIEETARAVDAIGQLQVGVPALIVNRVLPAAEGAYHAARLRQQDVYLREIDTRFSRIRRICVDQLESDVHGLAALDRVRAALFAP